MNGTFKLIKIQKINASWIYIDSSDEIIDQIDDYFSFFTDGYKYSIQYEMGRWDGKKHLFKRSKQHLPYGLLSDLEKFASINDYNLNIQFPKNLYGFDKKRNAIEKYINSLKILDDKGNKISPYDFQLSYILDCLSNERRIMVSPTASGKSLTIFLMILILQKVKFRKRVLIIVPTVDLVEQMNKDFNDYLGEQKWGTNNCYKIMAGVDKETLGNNFCIVSTWQSIYKQPESWFNQFGVVIIDEAHTAQGESITQISQKMTSCNIRIGTTGTIKDISQNQMILRSVIGPIIQHVTTRELIDRGILSKMRVQIVRLCYNKRHGQALRKFLRELKEARKATKQSSWREELSWLMTNKQRASIILKVLEKKKEENNLVIFTEHKHGKPLYDYWKKRNENVYWITGSTKVDESAKIRQIMEENSGCTIFSTFKKFSTGINIKNLNNLFLISSTKAKITVLQSIGRTLRKSRNGIPSTIYDFVDDMSYGKWKNHSFKHAIERVRIYQAEEFDVLTKRIDIN